MKQQIFVSSVQKELSKERRAIRDFIREDALFCQYFEVFLFEDLPAADRRVDDTYLDEVSVSAIYLGLFGNEYGSEDSKGVSPTEHEFDRATDDSVYRLAFIKSSDDLKRHLKMKKMVSKVSRQLRRRRFDTIDELLRDRIYPSLIEFLRWKGILFTLIDRAADFVMAKLVRKVGVREQGPENVVAYEIPKAAVAEIIINAVAHRDYQSDASVQIYVFADRVEVWNPGELPPTMTPAKLMLPHSSVPRNKRLCEALFLANYIDKAGTGILDVLSKCKEAGLPIPEFAQDGDQFVVTLWRDWLTQDAIAKLGLTDRQLSVIPHLKANQRITNAQYRKVTGVTDRTALRDLEDLVSKGVVVKSGKTGRGAGYLFVGKPDKNPTKPTNRGRK